jgi:hypothetical protein
MNDPRWAVITGASSGIGAEMARIYAARGRSLVLTARRADRLATLKAEIEARSPALRVETIVLDLEQPDGAEALVAELDRRGVETETLVNNAGFGLRGRFATLPYDDQVAMLQLNIVTLTKLCRLALPGLIARRRGGILNVASTASFQAVPFMGTYAATKAYVLSLSEALHEESRRHGNADPNCSRSVPATSEIATRPTMVLPGSNMTGSATYSSSRAAARLSGSRSLKTRSRLDLRRRS